MKKLILAVALVFASISVQAQPVTKWDNLEFNRVGQLVDHYGQPYTGKVIAFKPSHVTSLYQGVFLGLLKIAPLKNWSRWSTGSNCTVDANDGYLNGELLCRNKGEVKLKQLYQDGHHIGPMFVMAHEEMGMNFSAEHDQGELHGDLTIQEGTPPVETGVFSYAGGVRHGLSILYDRDTGRPAAMVEFEYGEIINDDACDSMCR